MKVSFKQKIKNEDISNKYKIKRAKAAISVNIFIVCLSLVSVIFIQFKTVQEVNDAQIKNMRETELRESISTWKSKYEEAYEQLQETTNKIDEYYKEEAENKESTTVLDAELQKSELLLGLTDVKGEGVVITLSDTEHSKIHSNDLLDLINELRFAGAEAISINDVRVTNMTDIVDIAGKFVLIKPKQRLSSPYTIKAIGDQTYLVSTLSLKNSGFIDSHTNSGQSVRVEKQKNIVIPKYSWDLTAEYMKEVNDK